VFIEIMTINISQSRPTSETSFSRYMSCSTWNKNWLVVFVVSSTTTLLEREKKFSSHLQVARELVVCASPTCALK
jgi:hypothetical protein